MLDIFKERVVKCENNIKKMSLVTSTVGKSSPNGSKTYQEPDHSSAIEQLQAKLDKERYRADQDRAKFEGIHQQVNMM